MAENYNRRVKRGEQSSIVGSVSPPNPRFGGEERGEDEARKSEYSLLGFGKYRDWAYGDREIEPNYVTYTPRMYGKQ